MEITHTEVGIERTKITAEVKKKKVGIRFVFEVPLITPFPFCAAKHSERREAKTKAWKKREREEPVA